MGFSNFKEIAWLITPACGCGTDFTTSRYKTVHRTVLLNAQAYGFEFHLQKKKPPQRWFSFGGDGGIRTHVPVKANAFRVRPVMTSSIRLHIYLIYKLLETENIRKRGAPLCPVAVPKICYGLERRQILTAATPYCSLHLPQAALANVPTSIRLHIQLFDTFPYELTKHILTL